MTTGRSSDAPHPLRGYGIFGLLAILVILAGALLGAVVGAGFGEEVFFRGYLFERIWTLLGTGRSGLAVAIPASTVLFALAHYRDQGIPGVEQAAVTGLVFAGLYAGRKELWVVMATHIAFDLTAVVLIYKGSEAGVAHWLLR